MNISKNDRVSLKKLELQDAKLIFDWRNDETIVQMSSSQKKVSWEEHQQWIKNSINNPTRSVYIVNYNDQPVGQVRFDKDDEKDDFVYFSAYLLSRDTNKGIGSEALRLSCRKYFQENSIVQKAYSYIRVENEISKRFVMKGGFAPTTDKVIAEHETFKLMRSTVIDILNREKAAQKNIDFYSDLIKKHDLDVKSLNWGSKQSQEMRFELFSQLDNLNKKSILDIGCGLGDFYDWLEKNNLKTNYKGIDITPKMIEKAKERFPNANFEVKNVLERNENQKYDYVVASGIFYLVEQKPFEFMKKMIQKMFEMAEKGIAFNSLSSWADQKHENEFYANPSEVVDFCRTLSRKVVLKHHYHPADFTIYLYK
ncbi:methyltransferase family protein [Bernardetia litoralis DSM 6794]|uniref:Methyltransferase family protein n=1 Tax=Bernardetia litoralis (strain ATCC 23117 / DSM 6794 / NBRC 15988 / NCIMB 1366 / Fx l1 / Sio-4) TaxID=880071 RepID=I4APG6_BERLS|nr:GNAT family N-acetyltransferase [Bernardetia litoralis]AFM05851.1 methyltransferase family protein [Bernardetia litoralis DSM 6794]